MAFLAGLFELVENVARSCDDRIRQSGKPRHLDAVGTVGNALDHLVQEDHLAFPFLYPDRHIGDACKLLR